METFKQCLCGIQSLIQNRSITKRLHQGAAKQTATHSGLTVIDQLE